MPNTRIRDQWEPMVKQIIAEMGRRTGPAIILAELKRRVESLKTLGIGPSTDYPSSRTVQRIKNDISDDEFAEYEAFHWPSSMENGAIPWEAGAAALELLSIQQSVDALAGRMWGRPSVRLARWYWRISQAAPDLPNSLESISSMQHTRIRLARVLAAFEAAGRKPQQILDAVEAYLSYAPWRSPGLAEIYRAAVNQGKIPELTHEAVSRTLFLPGFTLKADDYSEEATRELLGEDGVREWSKIWALLRQEEQDTEAQEKKNGEAPE